jgi:hypothetical protein
VISEYPAASKPPTIAGMINSLRFCTTRRTNSCGVSEGKGAAFMWVFSSAEGGGEPDIARAESPSR